MGARVGGPDHGSFVPPHLEAGLPVGPPVAGRREIEPAAQVFGHRYLACDVEGFRPQLGGRLADRVSLEAGEPVACEVAEHVLAEVGQARQHPASVGLPRCGLEQLSPALWRGQQSQLLGVGCVHCVVPTGDCLEQEPGVERQPGCHRRRHREAQHPAPQSCGSVRSRQLCPGELLEARHHDQHVPVERPVGCGGHPPHQRRLRIAERVHAGNELERRALVATHLLAEGDQFVMGGKARGHRPAVAVVVGRRKGGREPEAASGEGLAEQRDHLLDLPGGGLPLAGLCAHHRPADRRMAHEEPGVHGQ